MTGVRPGSGGGGTGLADGPLSQGTGVGGGPAPVFRYFGAAMVVNPEIEVILGPPTAPGIPQGVTLTLLTETMVILTTNEGVIITNSEGNPIVYMQELAETGILIEWDPTIGADEYTVEYEIDGSGDWVEVTGSPVATNWITIDAAVEGATYAVRVSATNDVGTSGWSDPEEILVPIPPSGFLVGNWDITDDVGGVAYYRAFHGSHLIEFSEAMWSGGTIPFYDVELHPDTAPTFTAHSIDYDPLGSLNNMWVLGIAGDGDALMMIPDIYTDDAGTCVFTTYSLSGSAILDTVDLKALTGLQTQTHGYSYDDVNEVVYVFIGIIDSTFRLVALDVSDPADITLLDDIEVPIGADHYNPGFMRIGDTGHVSSYFLDVGDVYVYYDVPLDLSVPSNITAGTEVVVEFYRPFLVVLVDGTEVVVFSDTVATGPAVMTLDITDPNDPTLIDSWSPAVDDLLDGYTLYSAPRERVAGGGTEVAALVDGVLVFDSTQDGNPVRVSVDLSTTMARAALTATIESIPAYIEQPWRVVDGATTQSVYANVDWDLETVELVVVDGFPP